MRKVVWALTGLALLRNLITLARENEEEKQWAWARNIRIMEFPLNIKECVCVCVCVCVLSDSQRLSSFPFRGACSV